MDALSTVLEALKFKGVVYNKVVFTASWGIDILPNSNSQFWRVLKGKCFIKAPDEPMIELKEGDFVFMPHGQPHWLASSPDSKRVVSSEFVKARDSGRPMFVGDSEETIIVGGHFEFDSTPLHPFIKGLPQVIYMTKLHAAGMNSWLQQTATLLFDEANHERPGSKLILSRLAEVAFVHLIRAYLEQTENISGFLAALKDERISVALKLMQEFPEREWTLDSLSEEAGMSRTLFFNKFKELVGETPMSYLTNWRIIKAKEFLLGGKENISDVALKVGYRSEAAFNRIFKTKVNETPANFRRSKLSA